MPDSTTAAPTAHSKLNSALPLAETRRELLKWFGRCARKLPWRSQHDPYRVWVSEVMLQQTRVEAVVEPYGRFLEAFPSLAVLARADEAEVLARWSGLGYYRRARLLHAGARHVAATHRGRIPRMRSELESVPGIGSYTAGALLSIAFGQREAALDANVVRVLARLCALKDPRSRTGRAEVGRVAAALVDCANPGDVNEALMDLGSALCTARVARCEACPLRRVCRAFASGDPVAFAGPRPRKAPRRVQLACAVTSGDSRVLFLRRPRDEALLGGLWDLPTVELVGEADSQPAAATRALRELIRARTGMMADVEGPVAVVRHDIIGRKISASVYRARLAGARRRQLPEDARMLELCEWPRVGLPALPVKILRMLGDDPSADGGRGARVSADRATQARARKRSSSAREEA